MTSNPAGSNLVLIGMPGSGKSTVGRRLAQQLGRDFLDTDNLLERRQGCTVQQLVDRHGLVFFRRAEQAVVTSLQAQNCVIATGGSAVYSDTAMQHLRELGRILFLQVSISTVRRRIASAMDRGLVMYPNETIAGLYHQRKPLYQRWADITVDNNRPLTELRVAQIIDRLSAQRII
ncbi:MAG: shikimate kinase [Gammaproteobacteria bacterium]|nr:shikimate kinase [Gammaproteobacteria bacterium]